MMYIGWKPLIYKNYVEVAEKIVPISLDCGAWCVTVSIQGAVSLNGIEKFLATLGTIPAYFY